VSRVFRVNVDMIVWITSAVLAVLSVSSLNAQVFSPEKTPAESVSRTAVQPAVPVLPYRVVSQEEMDSWPVDRRRDGEKLWAETTWGGDAEKYRKLFNYNIWPNRLVFTVGAKGNVARGEAFWRRSDLSVRLKGLKLLSAASGEEITDARVVSYDREKVTVEFRPVTGPGEYHLYFGAREPFLFNPTAEWLRKAGQETPVNATAERIEARCGLDSFYPMETIPLDGERNAFLEMFPGATFLVFPQDRDQSVKMLYDVPAFWVFRNPDAPFILNTDRNEYRVFQLGVWACRSALSDIDVAFSGFTTDKGTEHISAELFQCLTLTSRIKSEYMLKPSGSLAVPKGQVRALWCGIDLPGDVAPGEYRGTVTVKPAGQSSVNVPVILRISGSFVEERGDNDLWRLSRLRWIESDIGLSGEIFEPFEPLTYSKRNQSVSTWGHELILDGSGLPEKIRFGDDDILDSAIELTGSAETGILAWDVNVFGFTEATDSRIIWTGGALSEGITLQVDGVIEFDGCIVITVKLTADSETRVNDLSLVVPWKEECAGLASGMGYRGKRDGNRIWRSVPRTSQCFGPSLWMGDVERGLGWITWDTGPWEDPSRMDAATVTEEGSAVVLRLNFGTHLITADNPWQIQFALRPTPVKPRDPRHWHFRYLHRGGEFMAGDNDTPQSYLADNSRRLDELVDLGVTRLNLHDWWGPSFNYAWQWEGPDNLSRLTAEAHKRGIFVKVYNSGRELSTLAPEFWALVYEGTQYRFRDEIALEPRGNFQDVWHENHLPDGLPQGWPRIHHDLGNEHAIPVSNATRIGNFYLESIRYMTEHFGTDGAYWDGADGPTLGHREMAKRLWTIFKKTNPNAVIDAHHGTTLLTSPMTDCMLVLPFIDSIWHGEGFPYDMFDPWAWLVEISGLPFGVPSEMLAGEQYFDRGMLFGIWPRMGWGAGTEKQQKLWKFFDRFGIENAEMLGWWERDNGVTIDRPDTYVTAFVHPDNGVLLVISSWHPPLQHWVGDSIDVTLALDRGILALPDGALLANDVMTGEDLDIFRPVLLERADKQVHSQFYEYRDLTMPFEGRLIWVRGVRSVEGR